MGLKIMATDLHYNTSPSLWNTLFQFFWGLGSITLRGQALVILPLASYGVFFWVE